MSSEFMVFIGLIIGILAYVLLYLGKGIQKYAIEGLKIDKSIKFKHSGIWIFGTVLTTTYFFVQWAALFFAPINIIAPLGKKLHRNWIGTDNNPGAIELCKKRLGI